MASRTFETTPQHHPLLPSPRRPAAHAADIVRWVLFLAAVVGLLLTTAPLSFR